MIKTLRFSLMALMAVFSLSMSAQDVVLDFTSNDSWKFPEESGNKATAAAEFSNGTYTVTVEAPSNGGYYYFNSSKALLMGKTGATLTLPAFDFDVARIEVEGHSNASGKVTQNIFVGDVAVSTETTSAKVTQGYDIAADYRKAGNVYVLKVTNTNNTQISAIKIYKVGSTILKEAGLAFSESKVSVESGTAFTAPTFTKETTAAVTFASDNEAVATVSAEGVISLAGAEGTAVITATSEANAEFKAGEATCTIVVFSYNVYKKATAIESGKKYLLVAQRDDLTYYAYPIAESKPYGYLSTGKEDGYVGVLKIQNNYDDSFTFTTEGDGYSIKDCYGRYYTQSGTYKSFQTSETPAAWTVEPQTDGTFSIAMNGYTVQFGEGTYTSFGVYQGMQTGAVLPMLYVFDETASGIDNVVAPAEKKTQVIYSIDGRRLAQPVKGINIINGKKVIF